MALIRRSLLIDVLSALRARDMVVVEGLPRMGKTTLSAQLAFASRGAALLNARRGEGRDFIRSLKSGAEPRLPAGSRLVVLDDASDADALALGAWLSSGRCQQGMKSIAIGGPFAASSRPGAAPAFRLGPLSQFETGPSAAHRLWARGGIPEAYFASGDGDALEFLADYAARLAYGGLCAWGLPVDGAALTGILERVAQKGGPFNENAAARELGMSRPSVARLVGLAARAGLVRLVPALPPIGPAKAGDGGREGPARGKTPRVSASPAFHLSDSGLVHALRRASPLDGTSSEPAGRAGSGAPLRASAHSAESWTAFVVAQAFAAAPAGVELWRYASADGAALDIVATRDGRPALAAVARRHPPTSVERSISFAASALSHGRKAEFDTLVVSPDSGGIELRRGFISVGATAFVELLSRA